MFTGIDCVVDVPTYTVAKLIKMGSNLDNMYLCVIRNLQLFKMFLVLQTGSRLSYIIV
jgi:hypothetical protein